MHRRAGGVTAPVPEPGGDSKEVRMAGDSWWAWCLDWYVGLGERPYRASFDARKRDVISRLDSVGWGLILLLFASLALPNGVAEVAAVAGVGSLMLVLNAARIVLGIRVRWSTVILGTVALIAGGAALAGARPDVVVLFFVVSGVAVIASALLAPRPRDA
jgi:hypothetical protein